MTSESGANPDSRSPEAGRWAEFVFQLFLAAGLIGVLYGLVLNRPVFYTRLIAESNLGEDATFIALATAAVLFGVLAVRTAQKATRLERLSWLGVSLGAGLIAGEEISWGQRMLGFEPPKAMLDVNFQRELNIHNIHSLQFLDLHVAVAVLLLGWAVMSWLLPTPLRVRLRSSGFPLAPIHLSPLLLCIPWVALARPFPKPDEITELLFGIFLAVWALDQVMGHGLLPLARPLARSSAIALMIGLITMAATVMSIANPTDGMANRLNLMGYRDLPKHGFYAQSDHVMAHIYEHPDLYLMYDTRLEHGKLLRSLDRANEAREVLRASLDEPILAGGEPGSDAEDHRARGEALMLLGDTDRARAEIDQALAIRQSLLLTFPEDRAAHLLSISRSLAVIDRLDEALDRVREASDVVGDASLRRRIQSWTRDLENEMLARPPGVTARPMK